jgi:hypothetical protein
MAKRPGSLTLTPKPSWPGWAKNCAANATAANRRDASGYRNPARPNNARWVSRPYVRTALKTSECLGWAVITHPFHPLLGQRFRILKARTCSGRPTLILEGGEGGTFSVLREWTDRNPPSGGEGKNGPVLAQTALLELAALLAAWQGAKKKD